jgi:hypothetical protein
MQIFKLCESTLVCIHLFILRFFHQRYGETTSCGRWSYRCLFVYFYVNEIHLIFFLCVRSDVSDQGHDVAPTSGRFLSKFMLSRISVLQKKNGRIGSSFLPGL